MTKKNEKQTKDFLRIQVTAGRGPAECAWVCLAVASRLVQEAISCGVFAKFAEGLFEGQFEKAKKTFNKSGSKPELADLPRSVVLEFPDESISREFIKPWIGTIQWIGQSPFRNKHKRKNWFVAVDYYENEKVQAADLVNEEIRFETMRASGPGGQHVNKTESAVRAIHIPSGISVTVNEQRSQFANRRQAVSRLRKLLEDNRLKDNEKNRQVNWQNHNQLVRGNPVKTFYGEKFKELKNE